LQRAPYFAYIGLLFFIANGSQIVWLGSFPAMTDGFLWAFMLVDVIVGISIGYALAVIAMARSRDGFGHARRAVLAFLPIANLWLLGIPSKKDVSANRALALPPLRGAFGVLTGFFFIIVGAFMGVFIQAETNRMVAKAENDPAMHRASFDIMLRGKGLEETLRRIAADVPRQRVDEMTILLRVLGDGTTLRYVYEVSTSLNALPTSLRLGLVRHNCNFEALRHLIEAGATIEHLYQRPDGTKISIITVTREICRE
jgi:hypothetical protein